jgi:single-strand DNA-binding protein
MNGDLADQPPVAHRLWLQYPLRETAMANLNKVMLMGNLTRDIRLTYTPSNTAVAKLGMAINRTWTGQDGQKHEEVTFLDLTSFGKQAETLNKYLHKGDPLFVEGRLKLDTWDDKQTGQKRSKLEVIIEGFQFLGRSAGGSRDGGQAPPPPARSAAPAQQGSGDESSSAPTAADYNTDVTPPEPPGDDIPF